MRDIGKLWKNYKNLYMQKHWYLQQIDLFQGIPDEEIMRIAKKTIEKKCVKKEIIYMPNEANNSIYVLKKGEITLYNSHAGKRLIIEVLGPGSIFGNLSFQKNKTTHFAEASQDSCFCIFSIEDFTAILHSKPKLMIKFLQLMSERMRNYEKRLKGGLFDAKEKILQQLEIFSEKGKNDGMLNRLFGKQSKMTHERLAELTGLSRETVTRAINDLKKSGIEIPL